MVYGTYNELVTGAYKHYKPTYNWGASHCMRCRKHVGKRWEQWDLGKMEECKRWGFFWDGDRMGFLLGDLLPGN